MSKTWTDERLQQLKQLREQGLYYSQIGRIMGVSRNSAISAGKRWGVVAPCVVHPKGGRPRTHAPKASTPPPPPPVPSPESLRTPMELLPFNACRFPLWGNNGGAPNFECCGVKGFPWCDYHRSIIKGRRAA